MRLSLQKLSVMDSYTGSNLQYFWGKNARRHCPPNYRGKYCVWNIAMFFKLSKKDHATRHVLKTKLSFKSLWKYLRPIVCTVISLLQNFRAVAYNLHICGKVKVCNLNIMSNLGKYRLCYLSFAEAWRWRHGHGWWLSLLLIIPTKFFRP